MRRCPTCNGVHEAARLICPLDGDLLVEEGRTTPESGRVLSGRYRLANLLGEGGMGKVYEAERLDTGERVAVKLLKPGHAVGPESRELAEKRLRVEAEAAAALDHPGVVRIFEFGSTPEGESFIAMERLRGATFDDLRRAGKLASPRRVVELVREVCDVLAAAHRRGIVHRDLKPSNLYLHRIDPERSQVKVFDFGIAKILDSAGERLTSTGEFLGTLLYMAPEMIAGQAVTRACDIYSLGVILFEALAGQVPFAAKTPFDLLRFHSSMPAPSLSSFRPDVSRELDKLVARCLYKKPANRFADAEELGRALAELTAVEAAGEPAGGETRVLRANPARWVGLVLDDRYEIQEWVSPGRFGSDVFRALHLRTGAGVAVRIWRTGEGALRDLLLDAYRREARAMGLRHPNLIAILDLGFNDDCVYLVTELVESMSLRTLLLRRGTLPSALAAGLVAGAAEGLAALHEKGIVSGGLSPETIRVTGGPEGPERLLLTPFGLADLKQLSSLLPLSAAAGTPDRSPDYISPEQRAGGAPDARSDLYSLALILLEMLAGPLPGAAAGTTRARWGEAAPAAGAAADAPPVLPEGVSPVFRAFIERALASEPARRFAGAREFLAALPRG